MPGSGQALEEMVGNLPVVRNLLIESVCHILVEPNVLPEHVSLTRSCLYHSRNLSL